MTFAGIPTVYNSVRFRSRLEARWACFFDLVKWDWGYEPTDFKGWIPDFALYGAKETVYVEVKPVTQFPEGVAKEIENSGCTNDVLIVGQANPIIAPTNPEWYAYYWGPPCIGWLAENNWSQFSWNVAPYNHTFASKTIENPLPEITDKRMGFCHAEQSYRDRITGVYDGNHYLWPADHQTIRALWAEASNNTQWRPQ